ncbi:hypothetical protein ACIP5N_34010 [Streptomyces sp. NPDC088768]|uniref:hypothetical protein n=1 Tax=Streptomyces sp. NPDC088768 TaxID=3365894 RepID=UPI003824AB8B
MPEPLSHEREALLLVQLAHDSFTRGGVAVLAASQALPSATQVYAMLVARTSAPHRVFRAQSGSVPLGTYSSGSAAQRHCEADLADRHPGSEIQADWYVGISEPERPWVLLARINGGPERPVGYEVVPIDVAVEYDPLTSA